MWTLRLQESFPLRGSILLRLFIPAETLTECCNPFFTSWWTVTQQRHLPWAQLLPGWRPELCVRVCVMLHIENVAQFLSGIYSGLVDWWNFFHFLLLWLCEVFFDPPPPFFFNLYRQRFLFEAHECFSHEVNIWFTWSYVLDRWKFDRMNTSFWNSGREISKVIWKNSADGLHQFDHGVGEREEVECGLGFLVDLRL